jgi:hypothetical protein
MALVSPGVQVTVIDESQYLPAATNSVPYFLIATAQNKVSGAGVGVAAGTLKVNANRTYLITSQRDLSATFGVPFFYKTTAGTPINGYELNEYGLLAAYSALGSTSLAYVQRADIDLSALTATLVRPTGSAPNGTYWLDTANTTWGIFQWNITTNAFTNQKPLVINSTTSLESNSTVPLQSIGSIGNYAVVVVGVNDVYQNPIYFKRGGPTSTQAPGWLQDGASANDLYNTWVLVGSDYWKTAWPTIQSSNAPTSLINGNSVYINGVSVPTGTSVSTLVTNINALSNSSLPGVYAANIDGKLCIYADSGATADGSTGGEGAVLIQNNSGTPLTTLGISEGTYLAPAFQASPNYQTPRWGSTQTNPEPTGSVWQKSNNVNLGVNLVLKQYDSALATWVQQTCGVYASESAAIYALDPSGGGKNIPVGTTYALLNPAYNSPDTAGLEIFERYQSGTMSITGDTDTPSFLGTDTFSIVATQPGTSTLTTPVTAYIQSGSASDFVAAVSAAAVPYVSAAVDSNGAIVMTHSAGGDIYLRDLNGTPVEEAGFNTSLEGVSNVTINGTDYVALTGWATYPFFTYTASTTAPDQDPADGTYWYYSATNQADIMIQNGGHWVGYQTVLNDVRGYNLTLCNATGPIISATAPTTQTNTAQSPLAYGDLWVNTSDLENYPLLYRWENVDGQDQWVLIDNTDQTTSNGILFADARWAPNGSTNPISDPLPTITSLLKSNYLDVDAPVPTLYPQGTLLWNTRRSGFNVKSFQVNYFNVQSFSIPVWDNTTQYIQNDYVQYNGAIYNAKQTSTNQIPTNTTYWWPVSETNTWLNASGNAANGSPYMGRQAQRVLIVQALKAGLDSSVQAREEQRQFNLISCPQYPELIPNMVELSNDRNNTCFVVGDTPLRLEPNAAQIIAWDNDSTDWTTSDGLQSHSAYQAVFYPSCQTTDLSGTTVVQPPSHMMVRTIIRSDAASFPWLAPAGTRRGVADNALRIGYIEPLTGEFVTIGVNQGLRDVLYQNNINPITFVPGIGITNFGNKTGQTTTSALDRINVARLIVFLRARLEEIGKLYLFEPNDQITRNEITNAVNGLMIDLIAKRGIYDYLVVCDLSNNTPARIDANELWVDIAIEPVKAVEFIYIPLRIKNTGEIAASTAVTAQAG